MRQYLRAALTPIYNIPTLFGAPQAHYLGPSVPHPFTLQPTSTFNLAMDLAQAPAPQPTLRDSQTHTTLLPSQLHLRLSCLFPNAPSLEAVFSVLHLQRTQNNTSIWSSATSLEREECVDQFVKQAKVLCEGLREQGYWADFIDPTSGMSYYDSYSNSTLYEVDEDFPMFGVVELVDLGCCRALEHPLWGCNVIAGVLLSNAPQELLIFPKQK